MIWQKIKLGDVCEKIGSGATPKGGAAVYTKKGVSFIRSQNVYNLEFDYDGLVYINNDTANKLKNVEIKEKDVLLNITGDSVARTCLVPIELLPARVNQHVSIIRPDKKVLNPIFLNYYFVSPYMQAYMLNLAVGKGTSRNAITKGMIMEFEVPCPPMEIQKKVISILKPYDDLIENNKKQIKLLEEAAQRLYKEWFVDYRFPGYEDVEFIDGIPEEWKKNRADSFFNITIGKTPPRAEKQCFTDGTRGIPWLSISDMGNEGMFIFNTSEGITNEAIIKHNVKVVPSGTIFVSFKLTVGRVAIATTNMCTNEAIAHFYISNSNLQEYTYFYLNNFEYDRLGNTSSISKAVNSKIIKSMPFIMPSEEVLKAFSLRVNPILRKIKVKQKQRSILIEARDRLLPKLMSGEIEV